MSAIPSFAFQNMDSSLLDDTMDVASSPFRQPDDLDVELESVREPSIIESLHDDMIDDAVDPAETGSDMMQDQIEEILPDDDMIDDENTAAIPETRDEDFNMDAFADGPRVDEDEDILYEDDEDLELPAEQREGSAELKAQQEIQSYQEAEVEVILDDVEEQHDEENSHNLATNEAEAATRTESSDDIEDPGQVSTTAATTTENPGTDVSQAEAPDGSLSDKQTSEEVRPETSVDQAQEVQVGESYVVSENVEQGLDDAETTEQTRTYDTGDDPVNADLQQQDTEPPAGTQKDTAKAIHPVTLLYLDEEMSLFPPMIGDESSVYFLADSSLAFEPLDKLLAACREILTGTLDHHDELVLDITSLGLHICEDSKHAAQITLSQILDVYLQLCRNDEGQEIHPLYCHLSSRVSLASQYAYLVSSCTEGRTFSEIAADHIDTPEPEEEHTDAAGNPQEQQGEQEGYGNQDASLEEHSNEYVPDEQPTASEPEIDARFDATAAERTDIGETVNESTGQGIDTAPSGEISQEHAEEADPSGQETEQAAADITAQTHDEGDGQMEDDGKPLQASGRERESYLETADLLEAQEHETNSSHTLEADTAGDETDYADVDADGLGTLDSFDESFEQAEDLFEHDKDVERADEDDLGSYSDEELFAQEAGVQEEALHADAAVVDEGDYSTLPVANEYNQPDNHAIPQADENAQSALNGPGATSGGVPEPVSLASSPVTPSKANNAKRKVDDDELDLLDLDTPEPKRRRPS
ncbi:hypothetical protein A1O1_07107 [Capronia coronata CBS 617.96]|uniref:Uncharacterized protein n=1 Tax=Capronia coronata CBS 617.96 TaxID=1182541 RepID=W9YMI9_9EURO|nr:uncharacterized protein A1O1_07107 [Capronia coronata CBS 617.96]EXJ83484.1 hypothetical protein A1O1_07107 [Capronia coronata CBS 617.96]